jgi:hypothetical protein
MEDVGKLAFRQFFTIRQRGPDEVLQARQSGGNLDDPLALLELDRRRHALPEVCHGVDDVGTTESALETIGIVEIGLDEFDALGGKFLAFGRGDVSGQTANMVLRGFLEECLYNGSTLWNVSVNAASTLDIVVTWLPIAVTQRALLTCWPVAPSTAIVFLISVIVAIRKISKNIVEGDEQLCSYALDSGAADLLYICLSQPMWVVLKPLTH